METCTCNAILITFGFVAHTKVIKLLEKIVHTFQATSIVNIFMTQILYMKYRCRQVFLVEVAFVQGVKQKFESKICRMVGNNYKIKGAKHLIGKT